MREVAVLKVAVTGVKPTNTQLTQVTKLDLTSPANSWNTLAVANGCRIRLPDVNDVPTRRERRPRSLSMRLMLNVPESSAPNCGSGRPTVLNGSTWVRDQMKPSDVHADLDTAESLTLPSCAIDGARVDRGV